MWKDKARLGCFGDYVELYWGSRLKLGVLLDWVIEIKSRILLDWDATRPASHAYPFSRAAIGGLDTCRPPRSTPMARPESGLP